MADECVRDPKLGKLGEPSDRGRRSVGKGQSTQLGWSFLSSIYKHIGSGHPQLNQSERSLGIRGGGHFCRRYNATSVGF